MATKRSSSDDTGDTGVLPANKSQRVANQEQVLDPTASFRNLPIELKVHIFSNLSPDDLNNVAEVNRECNAARNNESLPQERTGTLVFTARTTPASFARKMNEVVEVFVGNRTRLKIERIETTDNEVDWLEEEQVEQYVRLPHITCLDCSSNEGTTSLSNDSMLNALGITLPNLREVNFNNVVADTQVLTNIFEGLQQNCSNLSKFSWKSSDCLWCCGSDLEGFSSLAELNLDNSNIYSDVAENGQFYANDPAFYLLMNCRHLERLSLKGASLEMRRHRLLPQDVLVKMVRNHASLRWLRSDLSAENVEMLKRERPEIEFVSE